MKYCLLALLLSSCVGFVPISIKSDSRVTPIVNEFILDAVSRNTPLNVNLTILFSSSVEEGTLAFCRYGIFKNTIVISESKWKKLSDFSKKAALYHELGHCVLYLSHNEDISSYYKQPESIMYPTIFPGTFFKSFEKEYIDQLFGLREKALQ